jgi:glycosyltransferase involved in cell wall biosynthesis
MNLVFAGDRCNDHSPSSGYDQVCSLFPQAGWLSGRALEAGQLEWYRDCAEPGTTEPRVFHVIYGDCSGKALPELLRVQYPQARIVSSVHRPIQRLVEDQVAYDALKASDAIVTLSEIQAQELQTLELAAPIYVVPHGVWTKVFRPPPVLPGRPETDVLLVGSFLRDWEGAKRVAELLARAGVRSVALGAGARKNLVGGDTCIEVLARVSEEDLAQMYQRSAVVFLPFMDATASNALLEAMAAGCPVICPRFSSLRDYLVDDSDTFEAGQYEVAAARILHYVFSPANRIARAKALIARAEDFEWSRLKPRFEAIYAAAAAGQLARPTPQMDRAGTRIDSL